MSSAAKYWSHFNVNGKRLSACKLFCDRDSLNLKIFTEAEVSITENKAARIIPLK